MIEKNDLVQIKPDIFPALAWRYFKVKKKSKSGLTLSYKEVAVRGKKNKKLNKLIEKLLKKEKFKEQDLILMIKATIKD